MNPVSGDSAPEAIMSRSAVCLSLIRTRGSDSASAASAAASSPLTVRSISSPPCGAITFDFVDAVASGIRRRPPLSRVR